MTESYDGAQLSDRLGIAETEFTWYIFEGTGQTTAGPRRAAGLISVHRTGPRVSRISLMPRLITARDLPAPLHAALPSWLPILLPVDVKSDDRPLFMAVLYDLDASRPTPIQIEHEIEHSDFDAATFSATALDGRLVLDQRGDATSIIVNEGRLAINLTVGLRKPPVVFGDGSPRIRHGRIETNYVQRPRLALNGTIRIDDITLHNFVGEGVRDHQWLRVTSPNLKWIWPHLRLPDDRELTGYVIRDSSGGQDADANAGDVLGRGGWLIERHGSVRQLPLFNVRAVAHLDTERGRVPTHFELVVPELGICFIVEHLVPAPFLRMRAFGDIVDGGIYESPIRVHDHPDIRGWVEVMNSAHVRLTR